jgi:hypothetical protein
VWEFLSLFRSSEVDVTIARKLSRRPTRRWSSGFSLRSWTSIEMSTSLPVAGAMHSGVNLRRLKPELQQGGCAANPKR